MAQDHTVREATFELLVGVLVTALLSTVLSTEVTAGAKKSKLDVFEAFGSGDDPKKAFALVDSNGDGRVDRTEFRVRKMYVFSQKDVNNDIKLSPNEIGALNADAFAAADSDGDGKLSGLEFNQADFTRFETLDDNGDGHITYGELLAIRDRLRQ